MGKDRASIRFVLPGSIAEEAGVEEDDRVISVNGEKIRDIFDYRFLTADENIIVEVLKQNGDIWEIEIEKEEYEDIGIEFEDAMMDEVRRCKNKCIFCFIDQLPPEMRESLYFKDDDSRLSFLSGNYITLTNMEKEDLQRILRYKMSPVNVSVHTTNPGLRIRMLNNKSAGDVLEKIKFLVNGKITVNCQIVLCRGINDGAELDSSIAVLTSLYPGVGSISVVPVGITKHRKGLYKLLPYDSCSSSGVICQVEEWQQQLLKKYGSRIVFLADEFYIMADKEIPGYEEYESFPQIENGVGLIASLRYEFYQYIKDLEYDGDSCTFREVGIATGVSSYKFICELVSIITEKYDNIKVNIYEIKNRFFGENVTVTGLLTGRDIIDELSGKQTGCELLISKSMLKAGEEVFLDNVTVDMMEEQLKVKVTAVNNSGEDFIRKVMGI